MFIPSYHDLNRTPRPSPNLHSRTWSRQPKKSLSLYTQIRTHSITLCRQKIQTAVSRNLVTVDVVTGLGRTLPPRIPEESLPQPRSRPHPVYFPLTTVGQSIVFPSTGSFSRRNRFRPRQARCPICCHHYLMLDFFFSLSVGKSDYSYVFTYVFTPYSLSRRNILRSIIYIFLIPFIF